MTDTLAASLPTPRRLGADAFFAGGIVAMLTILFLPIPPVLIDLGLAFSIALSALILMVALWIQRPLDFSAFPTVLLIATILRACAEHRHYPSDLVARRRGRTGGRLCRRGIFQVCHGRRF